mmetsp:Transcript_66633/g.171513  ORF Transcript_66633/g.171513 Transcript_66633/m.171513 type:complete len:241 (+) Transcript_66633:1062-1784(+)
MRRRTEPGADVSLEPLETLGLLEEAPRRTMHAPLRDVCKVVAGAKGHGPERDPVDVNAQLEDFLDGPHDSPVAPSDDAHGALVGLVGLHLLQQVLEALLLWVGDSVAEDGHPAARLVERHTSRRELHELTGSIAAGLRVHHDDDRLRNFTRPGRRGGAQLVELGRVQVAGLLLERDLAGRHAVRRIPRIALEGDRGLWILLKAQRRQILGSLRAFGDGLHAHQLRLLEAAIRCRRAALLA